MTKKHFEAFAREIRETEDLNEEHICSTEDIKRYAANLIADVCQQDNPRFDRQRFLKACGLD